MNKKTIQILLGFLVIAALGGAVGYYIYKDAVKKESGREADSAVPLELSQKPGQEQGQKQEQGSDTAAQRDEKGQDNKVVTQVAITTPNLNRFVVNSKVSEDKKLDLISKMRDLSTALKEGPQNPQSYYQWLELASYRKVSEDYKGAAEIWLYMVKLWPKDKAAYENLGNLNHFYLKNFSVAEKYMLKVIELEPKNTVGYLNLYELYKLSYKEKADQAPKVLERGLAALPDDLALLHTLAEFYAEK